MNFQRVLAFRRIFREREVPLNGAELLPVLVLEEAQEINEINPDIRSLNLMQGPFNLYTFLKVKFSPNNFGMLIEKFVLSNGKTFVLPSEAAVQRFY